MTRALVANNLCFARSGKGIQCRSSDDVAVQGNMIVATGSCTRAVFVDSTTSTVDGVSVRDNDITVEGEGTWVTGVHVAARKPIYHISVVGNSVRGATEGIRFMGSQFVRTPVCALNRIDTGVTSPLLGIGGLPEDSIVVGGAAANSGVGRVIMGQGDPNRRVTGNVGDIFQRIDGGPGSTLYAKESGNGTKTGWTAK